MAGTSIRRVVLGALAGLGAVALLASLALLVTAESGRRDVVRQLQQLTQDEEIAGRIVARVQRQLDAMATYAQTGDTALLTRFRADGMAAHDEIRRYLFRPLRPEERRLVEQIRETHQRIEVDAQQMFGGETAGATPASVQQLESELSAFLALRRAAGLELLQRHDAAWFWLYALFATLVAAFLVALVGLGRFLQRRLLTPLDALSVAAAGVGRGDFDTRVVPPPSTELAAVADSFNRMAERLQAERRAALYAEHRFRDLVEGLSSVVWEADVQTLQFTYVSPTAESMLGYPLAELTRPGFWQRMVHPDDWDRVSTACRAAIAQGRDHELVYRAVRADGRQLWLRDSVRVGLAENSAPQWLRGTFTDITTAHSAADALRDSEERYHTLFDRVPVGLYRSTPSGELLDVNPALVAMLGYSSRSEVVGHNAAEMYVDPAERRFWQEQVEAATGVFAMDRKHVRHDGTIIWVRDSARAVRDAEGHVMFYEGALQDITERVAAEDAVRNSEARFRSLIENASDGVLILDGDGRIKYQSPAIDRMLGYAPAEMQGRTPFELVHPDDLDEVMQSFVNVKTPAGHGKSVEFRCRHADGSWRILHVMGTNLLDDPAVDGIVLNMIDATALRSLQQQLHHAQRLDAIGRLAGGIAHDFNNLLTAIRGYTDLLSDQADADTAADSELAEIRRAADRATELTRQLLAFGRKQVVRPRSVDVGSVVRELDAMLRRLLTEGIRLRTVTEDDCWVHIDKGQLEQIVVNLVVNSRDAGPRSGIEIGVERVRLPLPGLRTQLPPGGYVSLRVSDDGEGIEPDVLPLIFEPFFTTKDVGRGTGLGLATVYGIARDNGGDVLVDSARHEGTTVRILLPLVALQPQPEPVQSVPVISVGIGSEHILLVEDEPAVRTLAERVLRRSGYAVTTAANGADALEAAALRAPFDLLITDVIMPVMGGIQLAAELTERQRDLSVLFISGYTADTLPDTDATGRPLHFLEKPFSPATLASTVRRILDERFEPSGA